MRLKRDIHAEEVKPKASRFQIWLSAARPQTLAASFCPIILGLLLANAFVKIHWISAILCLITALFLQIGTNFANDYFDAKRGSDGPNRLGPTRATAAGLIQPTKMKRAFIYCFALAVLSGVYLLFRGGLPFVYLGIAAIISGLLYTGGPLPYGYMGLGDLFVFFFFGPVAVCGTYFLNTLTWSDYVLQASIAPGLLSVAILAVNNLRDVEEDRSNKKRTLAVLLGTGFVKIEYLACVWVAMLMPFYLFFKTQLFSYGMLTLFLAVLAKRPTHLVLNERGPVLNEALERTAKLLISFTILYGVGLLV
eukprot:COSAG01_NODE_5089_length_4494_cov_2.160865_4_plen_307_part_00